MVRRCSPILPPLAGCLRPSRTLLPGIDHFEAAVLKVASVACEQGCAMRLYNGRNLCIKRRDGTACRTPLGNDNCVDFGGFRIEWQDSPPEFDIEHHVNVDLKAN